MGKAIDSILAAPPLQRISPGAREAIASVEALAHKQSEATESAAQFSPVVGYGSGIGCSFTFNPVADTVDFESSNALDAAIRRHEGGFKVSIRF